jgi:hypothetical protein
MPVESSDQTRDKAKQKIPTITRNYPTIVEKPKILGTVKDFALGIIKTNSAYSEDFLKIIPKDLVEELVCMASYEELDDKFTHFLTVIEETVKKHPNAEQLDKFLRELVNKVYYAE